MTSRLDPREMEPLTGRWKVVDLRSLAEEEEVAPGPNVPEEGSCSNRFIGVEVVVEENGDAIWQLPAAIPEGIPLFSTTCCFRNKEGIVFLGGVEGESIIFEVEEGEEGKLLLSSEPGNLAMVLRKGMEEVEVVGEAFSLCSALSEGFFSDCNLSCSDGLSVAVHQAVLGAAYPEVLCKEWQTLVHALPSHLARVMLECVYSDTLPESLTVAQAESLSGSLLAQPKLRRLQTALSAFIEANNLKKKMIQLIDDLLTLLEEAKRTVSVTDMTSSAKVKYALKQLAKDAAVGASKLGLLCELYTRNKKEMNKADKREVIDYLRARVVVFTDLLRELMLLAITKWEPLEPEAQLELAQEIVPEVEQVWDFLMKSASGLKASLTGQPLSKSLDHKRSGVSLALSMISKKTEVKRLKKIRKEFLEAVELSERKRERWNGFSEEEKVEQVLDVVGKLVNEGTEIAQTMEARKNNFLSKNGLEWKRFCFYVDLYSNYLAWALHRVQALKDPLKPLLFRVLKFVKRSEVNEAMVFLEVLTQEELRAVCEEEEEDTRDNTAFKLRKKLPTMNVKEPATALAQGCLQLLTSPEHADMQFVLGTPSAGGSEDCVVILTHRVIVASRCQWAYRALQSGMKEETERKIAIPDVDEDVFRLFLRYIYSGQLDASSQSTDILLELMALADRLDTDRLQCMCVELLIGRVEDGTVFQLLAAADHYSVRRLREATLQYVLGQPEVMLRQIEGYSSLSEELQAELKQLLSGTEEPMLALRHRPKMPKVEGYGSSDSEASSEAGGEGELYQMDPHAVQFQQALEDLRAIVGPEASQDSLRNLLLVADMDINRAANYYFSQDN